VVSESWLNDRIENITRGQLLGAYMVDVLGGLGGGPLLLNVATPSGFELFILTAILFSFALVPILLTAGPTPRFEISNRIKFIELYRAAPLGVVGCFITGVSNGTLLGIGAFHAQSAGLTVAQVSFFMSAAVLGGMVFQWPLGALSNRHDRRIVFAAANVVAALFCLSPLIILHPPAWLLLMAIGVFGGLSFPT
jgi:hypothetical protein